MKIRNLLPLLFHLFLVVFGVPLYADCPFICPTADDISVQQQLDATAAAGGGVVQLEAREYQTCAPWIVGSNTHLRGAGRGATVLVGSATIAGKFVDGTYVGSSIGTVGTDHVTISDLTVDHWSCSRYANGISIMPSTSPDEVAMNALVERVEVLGTPGFHSYMIWNLRGQHVKILNNWIDGGSPSTASGQEGIESFGGHDVLISGNSVRDIGGACINTGAADVANTDTDAITIANNHLTNCNVGINLGTSNASEGPQNSSGMKMIGNTIIGARTTGIDIVPAVGSSIRDLIVSGNTIRDMTGSGVVGIRMRASGGTSLGVGIAANTISDNHIENIRGQNAHGIRLTYYPHVRLSGNTITGTDNGAIYAMNADDLEIIGNRIEDGGAAPVQLYASNTAVGFARFIVDANLIRWAGLSPGILILGGKAGVVRDNVLKRDDTATPSPVTVANGSCGVDVYGNRAWYNMAWVNPTVPACP
ncbi:MAG TPA: right-handed parallel beta-helix repeat-containing protein [Thermoanaerobaculia bacterium]|nr:right-handed parallel beta-helix repeat-containing protein [Thermoanaerobaculia bacterium]